MTDPELAIRVIDELIPDMKTKDLQKWHAILTTALLKIEKELVAVQEHTCEICFFKEYGYRDELPVGWQTAGGTTACFQHVYEDVKKYATEEPFESPPKEEVAEQTLEELMDLL